MELSENFHLEIRYCPFPEVGVELNPASFVYYEGNPVNLPNSTKLLFSWYRDLTAASAPCNLGWNGANLGFTAATRVYHGQPKIWTVVGSSRTYVPSKDDVGHCLRLVSCVVNHLGFQISNAVVVGTSSVRPLSPSPRCIVPSLSGLKRSTKPQSVIKNGGFRIVSYNLLADVYTKSGRDDYGHCPKENLTWEYRRQNLLAEILSYEADILCLQEVQSDHFQNFFQPEFARFGYSDFYKNKTKHIYNGKERITDGCATFFHSDKFNLVKYYEVEYGNMALPMINKLKSEHRQEGISRLMKDNIASVLILEETGNCHSRICVANTHLCGGKGLSDVRLFQVVNLITGLQKIDSLGIPVLVCGDMNSAPGSDTHTFLINGKVDYLRQENRDILGMSKYLKLTHSMHLANAYSGALDEHRNETLDYILYPENKLKVDGVLKIPAYESIGKKRLLPTPQWSSDHLALVANLRIKKAYRGKNYSKLAVDPWEELKQVKENVKVNNNFAVTQQAFKKLKKNHVKFHSKNGVLGSPGILDKRIMESMVQQCRLATPCHWAVNNINHQQIGCQ